VKRLSAEKRAGILKLLCEGTDRRSTIQQAGADHRTIGKLLATAGQACMAFQDRGLAGLKCNRLEVRKPWTFAATRHESVPEAERGTGVHKCSTWVAVDPASKLVVHWFVGDEGADAAVSFMTQLAAKLSHRIWLTSDEGKPCLIAVRGAPGLEIDFSVLENRYGTRPQDSRNPIPSNREEYYKRLIEEKPDAANNSANQTEWDRGVIRRHCKEYAPLTIDFIPTIKNHVYAFALHTLYHNFVKTNETSQVSPAMAAGIESRPWDISDIVKLAEEWEASHQD
jgi:hypothetical protein